MQPNQRIFLEFALQIGALRFGEFILKSGRQSPYFFNTGQFNSSIGLTHLGQAYAQAILHSGIKFDMLYGPAYKGIPLVISTCMALAQQQQDVPYAFNRKEVKDHGEGGNIVGSPIRGRVLILDDVISAGTSVRESVAIIRTYNADPVGIVIALDRQECADEAICNLPIVPILRLNHLLDYLTALPERKLDLERMRTYQAHYGTPGDI